MEKNDIIEAVRKADLGKIKEVIRNDDIQIFTINQLMGASHNEEYRIGLVPLLLKTEAENPNHFLKYKAVIDYIAKEKGIERVILGWKNPYFTKYVRENPLKQIPVPVPVSEQMRTYLRHLEVRHAKERKRVVSLLQQIDANAKTSDPQIRKAIQITKRSIVKNYRLLNPKTAEY